MSRLVKSRKLKVVSVCSVCGEPVKATTKDKAYRHGFKRYRITVIRPSIHGFRKYSQEDATPCEGSGKTVLYRRRTKKCKK